MQFIDFYGFSGFLVAGQSSSKDLFSLQHKVVVVVVFWLV